MSSNICGAEITLETKNYPDEGTSAKPAEPARKVGMSGKNHVAHRADVQTDNVPAAGLSEQALGALKKFKARKAKAPAKEFPRTPLHKRMQSGDL